MLVLFNDPYDPQSQECATTNTINATVGSVIVLLRLPLICDVISSTPGSGKIFPIFPLDVMFTIVQRPQVFKIATASSQNCFLFYSFILTLLNLSHLDAVLQLVQMLKF